MSNSMKQTGQIKGVKSSKYQSNNDFFIFILLLLVLIMIAELYFFIWMIL